MFLLFYTILDSDVPMTKCFQERQEATSADSRSNAKDVFIPSCKSDGTFSEIQCHKASGYCWCVSKDGKPLSGTSTKTSTPNCRGKNWSRKHQISSHTRILILISKRIQICSVSL